MDSHIDFDQNHEIKAPEELDFFEFFNDLNPQIYTMSHAEDIMLCGKLTVPCKNQVLESLPSDDHDGIIMPIRYFEPRSSTRLTRSDHTSNCKKPRRYSSMVMKSELSDILRILYKKKRVKSEGLKVSKHKWKVLMFGLVKFPPIDLRDMKNRQVCRNPGGKIQACRRSSWGHDYLLGMLSCKSHASVAVRKF